MKLGVWTIAAVFGLCALASRAHAEDGFLDDSFGSHGKAFTPVGFEEPWSKVRAQVAEAPNGDLVVAAETEMVRYLPNGQLDPSFGEGGQEKIRLPDGLGFSLGDLGVDREGRTVVVGTAEGPQASFAIVLRYEPNGDPDPSFGGGDGAIITSFGLRSSPSRRTALTTATLGAVDSQDRILLIGGAVRPVSACGQRRRSRRRDLLIARLTPTGALDRTFGDHGIGHIGPLETVASMALGGGGVVLAGAPSGGCLDDPHLALIRLRADGSRDRRFGDHGSRRLTGSVAAIALDDRRRIVLLCRQRQVALDKSVSKIDRLLPDGRFDPSFHGPWVLQFEGPIWRMNALVVDKRERPIRIGTLIHPLSPRNAPPFHRWFSAIPVRRSGLTEHRFGLLGWGAITRFDPHSDLTASEGLIDREGRLVIAGTGRRPRLSTQPGLALARFELDP